jgi:hypothetical protein
VIFHVLIVEVSLGYLDPSFLAVPPPWGFIPYTNNIFIDCNVMSRVMPEEWGGPAIRHLFLRSAQLLGHYAMESMGKKLCRIFFSLFSKNKIPAPFVEEKFCLLTGLVGARGLRPPWFMF